MWQPCSAQLVTMSHEPHLYQTKNTALMPQIRVCSAFASLSLFNYLPQMFLLSHSLSLRLHKLPIHHNITMSVGQYRQQSMSLWPLLQIFNRRNLVLEETNIRVCTSEHEGEKRVKITVCDLVLLRQQILFFLQLTSYRAVATQLYNILLTSRFSSENSVFYKPGYIEYS